MQHLLAVLNPQPIRRINDPDEGVGFFKVVAPVGPKCFLAADVPCWMSPLEYAVALKDGFEIDGRGKGGNVQILSLYLNHRNEACQLGRGGEIQKGTKEVDKWKRITRRSQSS
jgi:hypothetical protein